MEMLCGALTDYFRISKLTIVTCDDVRHGKPDPEGIELALKRLGGRPEEAAMLGDHAVDMEMALRAGVPVRLGVTKTLYHIGLYTLAYVGVAMTAPWFVKANVFFLLLVVPISLKVLWEFSKYFRANASQGWLPFFLWTNLSLIVYLAVPVVDKWIYWIASFSV